MVKVQQVMHDLLVRMMVSLHAPIQIVLQDRHVRVLKAIQDQRHRAINVMFKIMLTQDKKHRRALNQRLCISIVAFN
jgi:hypothetical protein